MDAQHTCRQFDGNLPTIRDEKTHLHVSKLVGGAINWIGAYRIGPLNENDQFAWIDGSPLAYAPWWPGNPSNENRKELCVEMLPYKTYNTSWNDNDCWSENKPSFEVKNFVCQSDVRSIFKQECSE